MGAATMYRCVSCRVAFRWPQPDAEELSRLYQMGESDQWTYDTTTRVDWGIAQNLLLATGAQNVLDVGCFEGGFLLSLPGSVGKTGIEISRPAAEKAEAAGITILSHTIEDSTVAGQFDAVTAFDVIEHVRSPRQLLSAMAAHVEPGGVILISTGNLDCRTWRLMGPAYWYSALPEHLSFTSPAWALHEAENLGLVLERVVPFSHAGLPSMRARAAEAAKNLLYRVAPSTFAALRRRGMGGVDTSGDAGLERTPPIWITAQDQYLAVFRRPASISPI
ncbi:MAG: 2-polyprenyl-3-methyl-5-hydroxy-6-metoxy-1,4-benzoquinol methylase [Rhodothermales bacterium]|jgi:2-polyprenyl-3-methyl-5-hydroxy-6-metoxy-1,4-benzoquinol methylase